MTSLNVENPKVSIIVPNYNHARYLVSRLESLLTQTYQDWEIIILDDASTDGSLEIIETYRSDPRISILRNTENSGSPFIQWNKGARAARGKYIWIAEADDEAEPELLQTLVNAIEDGDCIVLAYCQSAIINSDGDVIGDMFEWTDDLDPHRWRTPFVNEGREEVRNYLFLRNTIPNASGVLMSRDAYLKAGGAPEDMRLCGDWLTYTRVVSQGKIAYSPRVLNRFRTHPTNVRSSIGRRHAIGEFLKVFEILCNESEVDHSRVAAVADWWSNKWIHFVQNTKPMPPIGWAWDSSRTLERLGGHPVSRLMTRYLSVKAWEIPGIHHILKLKTKLSPPLRTIWRAP